LEVENKQPSSRNCQ